MPYTIQLEAQKLREYQEQGLIHGCHGAQPLAVLGPCYRGGTLFWLDLPLISRVPASLGAILYKA